MAETESSLDKKPAGEQHGCVRWVLRVTGIVSGDMTMPNWKNIRIMFVALFSSAFTLCFLFPFLPDMVLSMGYKEEEKGYYCGLIASSVFAGRAFGSTNIPLAMALRFLAGVINGTVGTAKTVLYEISDNSNQALSMSSIGIAWGTGMILGPSFGGFLASPAKKFPQVFDENGFFVDYAFLLPSAVAGLVCLVAFIIIFFTFEETLRKTDVQIEIDETSPEDGEKLSCIASISDSQQLHLDTHTSCRFSDVSSALNFSIENLHYEPAAELSFANIERCLPYADEEEKHHFNSPQNRDHLNSCNSRRPRCNSETIANGCNKTDLRTRLLKKLDVNDELVPFSVPRTNGVSKLVDENTHNVNADVCTTGDKCKQKTEIEKAGVTVIDANGMAGSVEGCTQCHSCKNEPLQLIDIESLSQESIAKGNKSVVFSCIQHIRNSKLVSLCSQSEVRSSVMMYAIFSFGIIAFDDIFTVWLSTEPRLDGLGFSSGEIGTSLSAVAAPLMFLQILCYPATAKRLGLKWTFIIASFFIMIPVQLIPMLHLIYAQKVLLWTLLMALLIPEKAACNFCFTSISLMVNNSVSPENAGTVNGIAMTVTALARTMAPTVAGSLYSWSVSYGIHLGAPFDISCSFVVIGVIVMFSIIQGVFLPQNLDKQQK
ncbi:protein ZINC INDUCED FACILITATOR-LIKE 1-like isoform X2 [Gigantopelta aegis]|uniref:protein ZINC INDUCED FACILITATOR-LIKE 1-like isoform X2 n=1 Tax=Gigantopelta aegis TaxID=1735272 RepID=UPI001B88E1EF|nr:protein ZINC INDUCED FACILITATOR-LIKE 1-like isoform X2 [Gigantopelta aegis]